MNLQEIIEEIIEELQGQLDFTEGCIQEGKEAGLEDNMHVNRWIGIADTLEACIVKLEVLIETGSSE